jgi:hypothetical protein
MAILTYSMVLMIAVPCGGEREEQIPVTTATGVISSLKNYFLNGCIFLLSTKHQTETSKYSFMRLLSLRLVAV